MLYTFKETSLNRFITYTDTIVPLHNQKLVIVKGENGAGKSILFSSIYLLLQGQLPTGKLKAKDSKIIDVNSKILVDKDKYKVSLKGGSYKIKRNNRSITPYRKPDVFKLLNSIFPDDSIFNSTSFVSQFSVLYNSLISGSPALRMKIVESFIDQTKINMLKNKVKAKSKEIEDIEGNTDEIKHSISIYKEQIKRIPYMPIKSKEKSLQVYKEELENLLDSISNLEDEVKEYKRYKKAQEKVKTKKGSKEIKSRIKELEKPMLELSEIISDIKSCHNELAMYSKFEEKFYSLDTPKNIATTELKKVIPEEEAIKILDLFEGNIQEQKEIKKSIGNLSKVSSKICPTCYQRINKKKVATTIETLQEKLSKLETSYEYILDDVRRIATWCKVGQGIKNSGISEEGIELYLENGLAYLTQKVDKLDKEHSFLKSQLPYVLILEEFSSKKPNIERLQKLRDKKVLLKDKIERLSKEISYIENKRKQKEELVGELEECKAKLSQLSGINRKDRVYLPILIKTLNSREFRTEIIYDFCQALVSEWNLYSLDIFNTKVIFSIGMEQGYPSFLVSMDGRKPYDIRFMSGGEKKRLTLCMIPSILSIAPSPTNILVIDELDANVNAMGVEAMLNFLPKIMNSNLGKESIFFITSNKQVSHTEYQNWIVERSGDISNLIRR